MTSPKERRAPDMLVARISTDLRPVRPLGSPVRRLFYWGPIGLALFLGVPTVFGPRADASVLGPWLTWGASTAQFGLGLFLVWVGGRESTPGRRQPMPLKAVALATAGSVILALTTLTFSISPTGLPASVRPWNSEAFCFRGSLAVGSPLLFLAGWWLRRLLPAQPWLAGALLGAGAGLTADAGWRLVCPVSNPWHVLVGHGGAVIVLTVLGAATASLMARRIMPSDRG